MIRKAETKLTPPRSTSAIPAASRKRARQSSGWKSTSWQPGTVARSLQRFDDAAVTGDSDSGERPGLADLLAGSQGRRL